MAQKRKSARKPTVDPELKRQLADATDDANVQAVFTLRTPVGQKYLCPADTSNVVEKLIHEGSTASRSSPQRVKVFANAQSFAVSGRPALVRSLLEHSEIASAMANVQREGMAVRPVKPKGRTKQRRTGLRGRQARGTKVSP